MQIHQKILIVDDKHENLVALRQVLRDTAAEVIETTNGNDALSATLDHSFALAILDVMMPGMNGFELAEHLRSDETTKSVPIIFLTALRPDEKHLFDGYEAGGVDFIVKPYAPEVLLAKVRVFLELDRKRQELQWHHDQLDRLVHERTCELEQQLAARKRAEAELQSKNLKLDALLKVSTLRYEEKKSLSDEILLLVVQMTESRYGFYGFVNEDETVMTIHAWSGEAMQNCSIRSKPGSFSIQDSGIWAEAIRNRTPLIVNDYSLDHPGKHGLPDGHVQLNNLLVVPLMQDNRIVSVAAVANRHKEYTAEDVEQVTAFLTSVQSVVDRSRIEHELRLSNENLRLLTESVAAIPWTFNMLQNQWTYVGPQTTRILGYAPDEWTTYQWWQDRIHPEDRKWVSEYCASLSAQGKEHSMEYRMLTKDGAIVWVYDIVTVQMGSDGNPEKLRGMLIDISERKKAEEERLRLEARLRQAHKLEAIGRLAGGVAHDFNNKLAIILGYAELMKLNYAAHGDIQQLVTEIYNAGIHSRDIALQLLTFSRQQVVSPEVLDPNSILNDTRRSLPRLIGEDIVLQYHLADGVNNIMIDPVQLDQIIMNLAANARDAMPKGGSFVITTANTTIHDCSSFNNQDAYPGEFVKISFSDTGHGMDTETLTHIFEPFYTTKEVGKGSGLGLATIYGIVTQNKGFISIESQPDAGTTFNLFLPRCEQEIVHEQSEPPQSIKDNGKILLVEDEEGVRQMVCAMLEHIGYTVVQAASPEEGIRTMRHKQQTIDLIITDVTMPGMSGKEMYNIIAATNPEIKVLFMSGYPSDNFSDKGIIEADIHYINKPFSMNQLYDKIQEAIT